MLIITLNKLEEMMITKYSSQGAKSKLGNVPSLILDIMTSPLVHLLCVPTEGVDSEGVWLSGE